MDTSLERGHRKIGGEEEDILRKAMTQFGLLITMISKKKVFLKISQSSSLPILFLSSKFSEFLNRNLFLNRDIQEHS